MDLKTALQSMDTFLEYIRNQDQLPDYKNIVQNVEKGSHPTNEMLYDYVLDLLNEEDEERVDNHIAFCRICRHEVLVIMEMEESFDKGLISWANSPS